VKTIHLTECTDEQGELDLHIATGMPESTLDVLVVLQPASSESRGANGDWGEFLSRFNGICESVPLERGPQGEHESRESWG
jgi:hypothetical protein